MWLHLELKSKKWRWWQIYFWECLLWQRHSVGCCFIFWVEVCGFESAIFCQEECKVLTLPRILFQVETCSYASIDNLYGLLNFIFNVFWQCTFRALFLRLQLPIFQNSFSISSDSIHSSESLKQQWYYRVNRQSAAKSLCARLGTEYLIYLT